MTTAIERSSIDGISVLRAGHASGFPLVMLHGIGSNAQSYAPLMTILAAGRPVIAWDAPGYGASTPLGEDWPTADSYAAALEALVARLGYARFDLLGHSLGALVAGRCAVRHAGRINRLILASPALGYRTAPLATLAPPAANRLQAMLDEGGVRFAATRGPRLVHSRDNSALVAGVVKAMSEVKLPGYQQASRMLSMADLVADAALISIPTLVLVGAGDEITPPANCRRVYEALVAATPSLAHRFELVPAAGHAVPQEQPEAVADLIAAFTPASGG
jgi:pimeloyl-ACP methyl ester carboxylesterase